MDTNSKLPWHMRCLITLLCVMSVKAIVKDDNFVLFSDGDLGVIYQMSLDGSTHQSLPLDSVTNTSIPIAVDYDPFLKQFFWSDLRDHVIMRADLEGTKEEVLLQLSVYSRVEGIAVDSNARLLFYTDDSARTLNALSLRDGATKDDTAVLVRHLRHPRSVRLDPINRHVYWTDWGLHTIERVTYSGGDRMVLRQGTDAWINGLALDLPEGRMYWSDAQTGTIESALLNGSDHMVIVKVVEVMNVTSNGTVTEVEDRMSNLYGVAVDPTSIFYTDWFNGSVIKMNKDGTNMRQIGPGHFERLLDIRVFEKDMMDRGPPTGCGDKNGGCQSMCFPTTGMAVTCTCPEHTRILPDKKKCSTDSHRNGPDVMWLEYDPLYVDGYVRGIKGDPDVYLSVRNVRTWAVRTSYWQWGAIDFNYKTSEIYLFDTADRYIMSLSMNGTYKLSIIHHGTSREVGGLAYDWLAGNLYWTDSMYNWIQVTRVAKPSKGIRTLIRDNLHQPHGIAVHPTRGMLYWTDWGSTPKIERSTLAGTNRMVVTQKGLLKPTGLAIDYTTDKLYCANGQQIVVMELDGSDLKVLAVTNTGAYVDVSLYNSYVFATETDMNKKNNRVWFYDSQREKQNGLLLNVKNQVSGVVMYDQSKQPPATSGCATMDCEHICVSTAGRGGECICHDGYNLDKNTSTCVEHDLFTGAHYIYTLSNRICSMEAALATKSSLPSNIDDKCFFYQSTGYKFQALDFNAGAGILFFSENLRDQPSIRRVAMNYKSNNSIIITGSGKVQGLAYDWTTGNLYYTENTNNMLWVAREDGNYQKPLFRDLADPRGVVVYPQRRLLYWVEHGKSGVNGKLSASYLDGSGMNILLQASAPTGLTLDSKNARLYWIDNNVIKSMSVMGGQVTMEAQGARSIHSLAINQDFLIVTFSTSSNAGISVINKKTKRKVKDFIHNTTTVFDVVAFSDLNQRWDRAVTDTKCIHSNGGCQQLCLPRAVQEVCACIDGMRLAKDEKSCIPDGTVLKDDFVLIADDYRKQIYQSDNNLTNILALPTPYSDRPIGLAYDFKTSTMYWSDFNNDKVRKSKMDGQFSTLMSMGPGSRIDGLVFEPESDVLYYTDTGVHTVGVMSTSGRYHKLIIKDGIYNPGAIALHPTKGWLYFTVRRTGQSAIMRADMAGANPVALIKDAKTLQWPNGLCLDIAAEKMYWVDSHLEVVGKADLDGKNANLALYKVHYLADPFAITVIGDWLYWTDWNRRGIYSALKDGSSRSATTSHKDTFSGLNDIKYFKKSDFNYNTPCSRNNGGCSHFCFPVSSDTRVCACPDTSKGEQSPEDGKTCPSVAKCPDDVPNGNLDSRCARDRGANCTFHCKTGYRHSRNIYIVCRQDLEWNRDVTKLCTLEQCGQLQYDSGSGIQEIACPYFPAVNQICHTECQPGYIRVKGDVNRTCQADGTWSGNTLVCSRQGDCEPMDEPTNGYFTPPTCTKQKHNAGGQCQLHCNKGYEPSTANTVLKCVISKEWLGQGVKCVKLDKCPSLRLPQHTSVTPTTCSQDYQSHGTVCTVSCSAGYERIAGSPRRECQADSTWTGVDIQCARKSQVPGQTTKVSERTTKVAIVVTQKPGSQTGGDRGSLVPLLIAIVVVILLLAAVIIAVLVLLYRRSSATKRQAGGEEDTQEVIANMESIAYDHVRGTVAVDGSRAFENLGYGTTAVSQPNAHGADEPKLDLREMRVEEEVGSGLAFANPLHDVDMESKEGITEDDLKLDLNENTTELQ